MKSLASTAVLAETRGRLWCITAEDRPLWGRMTATEMVRHLDYACEIAMGERAVNALKTPLPPKMMKFLALRSGMRWPKNVESTPELKQAIAEPSTCGFEALLRVAIEQTNALASGRKWAVAHPMFGAMTVEDWMRWGYLHTDHHLRQFGR